MSAKRLFLAATLTALTVLAPFASATPTNAVRIAPDLMDHPHAVAFCRARHLRLPTIREWAKFAQIHGAIGIKEHAYSPKDSHVSYRNPDLVREREVLSQQGFFSIDIEREMTLDSRDRAPLPGQYPFRDFYTAFYFNPQGFQFRRAPKWFRENHGFFWSSTLDVTGEPAAADPKTGAYVFTALGLILDFPQEKDGSALCLPLAPRIDFTHTVTN